ncbi:MAG: antibiotic biosynthesis monooxygenase [Steroidobacteraceae bacterium]
MEDDVAPESVAEDGATVVITHRVRPDSLAKYEAWLGDILPLAKAAPGHLDVHVVRPIAGRTSTFTVIIRFDSCENLNGWMHSATRAKMISRMEPFFVHGDDYHISSGLEFWFRPPGGGASGPVRWKQLLVTWSALFPLGYGVSLLVKPLLQRTALGNSQALTTLIVSGIVLVLMVYVVMPRYTRLVRRWLFS